MEKSLTPGAASPPRKKRLSTFSLLSLSLPIFASAIYLLTLEPSVSFWDSGEFIAVAHQLQVGHPPGAPLYQLLAHAFGWFAFGNKLLVAPCMAALSALAAGFTVLFLFWTILLLFDIRNTPKPLSPTPPHAYISALAGALCYLFCDTAWFSAVECEVYSLAMLLASAIVWAMLRWYLCPDPRRAPRWLCLIALLLGLGVCTHLLTLLTLPTLLLLFLFKKKEKLHPRQAVTLVLLLFGFGLAGLSPYLIVPIRAAANPPINEGHPSTFADFKTYVTRSQYEHAPLYPRMWRHHKNDALYAADWSGGDTTLVGNLRYYASYQLTYMYLRYLMWNFAGRYNDRQGFGSPQNGQFITGLPPLDRLLVGTSARLPGSLPTRGHNVYYLLPLLLGIIGFCSLLDHRKPFWAVTSLFLMGGIILSLYLNHPAYEPRERDYVYILSFYAFAIFIAFGSRWVLDTVVVRCPSRAAKVGASLLICAVPALMACQNWDDHDRSHRFIAHDTGANMLRSCDRHAQGTVLFTYGDNDTFPLWYLQTVEQERTDIRVENIGLMGHARFFALLEESLSLGRPVYFTHYAHDHYRQFFPHRMQLEGNTYRLMSHPCDSVAVEPFLRHLDNLSWHPLQKVYIDETSCKFLEQYWKDILLLSENLSSQGRWPEAQATLNKTLGQIPLNVLQDVRLVHSIGQAYLHAGDTATHTQVNNHLSAVLREQLQYYRTLSPAMQASMPYTLGPREELYRYLCQ